MRPAQERLPCSPPGVILEELQDACIPRPKFARRLAAVGVTADALVVAAYAALAALVQPADIGPVIAADPDDDAVLACAAAGAEAVATGDPHLLELGRFKAWPS